MPHDPQPVTPTTLMPCPTPLCKGTMRHHPALEGIARGLNLEAVVHACDRKCGMATLYIATAPTAPGA